MVSTLCVLVVLAGLLFTTTARSSLEARRSRLELERVRAAHVAAAGAERGLAFLSQAVRNTSVHDPLVGLKTLFAAGEPLAPFEAEALESGGARIGAYSVRLTSIEETPDSLTIAVDSTGYVPDAPAAMAGQRRPSAWSASRTIVRYSLAPSEVFDYAYFLNNWGWFYGSTIVCNGNARSNGQFDAAGYAPTVTGQPLYESVAWDGTNATLAGYRDDNGDGLQDGKDGGIWSGWDIVAAQNVKGEGGKASNQHDFEPAVSMPNLTDLAPYEASAKALASSITIGGTKVANSVHGDEAGETQNLYLVGTAANPIVLDGPVVVRGHVLIKGVVTGKGAIYSGGNVYVPDSVTYKNGPTTPRPANNTQAATEAWLTTNWNKDFLGLFARENVVVGDFSHPTWKTFVGGWMADDMNGSSEDAGVDGMPNTRAGRDGVLGTADDDLLEDDGIFTTEVYTEVDEALGLIPDGLSVGSPIPGTGEDIDGDGVYDAQTTLADVVLSMPMKAADWGGNIPPAGIHAYASIASMTARTLDAVFYTNHSFCYVVLGGQTARINGALVSRNENIVYGTPSIEFNHDSRLLGRSSSPAAQLLPRVIQPAEILRWSPLDRDPHAGAHP